MRISHLMFADDVVLLGEASKDQAQVITTCLREFCTHSGQRVNTQKSSVYFSPNTNEAVVAEVCNTLGIPQTEDFRRYLGVPAVHGKVTKSTFQSVQFTAEGHIELFIFDNQSSPRLIRLSLTSSKFWVEEIFAVKVGLSLQYWCRKVY